MRIETSVMLATLILVFPLLFLCSCTDRLSYKYIERDPNGTEVIISGTYSESIGNSVKQDVTAKIEDHIVITIGDSSTDQDKVWEALQEMAVIIRAFDYKYSDLLGGE